MKYMNGYDIEFNYAFQMEISDELALSTGCKTVDRDERFPLDSRFKSERHPGWPFDSKEDAA